MTNLGHVVGSGSHDYSAIYDPDTDFDAWYTRSTVALIRPYLRPGDGVLELGCATGLMTSLLAPAGVAITGIERSVEYLALARARSLSNSTFIEADLATYETTDRFDHVLATNLLDEFDDPTWLLRRIAGWLAPRGLLHATVPNPDSIHRLAAIAEGMIDDTSVLSERAVRFGTCRVWPADAFRDLAAASGLEVVATGGVTLKPYPNAVMARLPQAALDGLARAAELLPDYAALHYTVFGRIGDRK